MSKVYWSDPAWAPAQGETKVFFYQPKPRRVERLDADGVGTGEYVFPEKVHIVKIPGDPKLRIDRPVTRKDKEQYPKEWAEWVKTKESKILGIPIDDAPFLSDAQKEEFKYGKILTIEQLAALSDSAIQRIMGGSDLRHKARLHLNSNVAAESQKQIDDLKAQVAEMKALMEQVTAPKGAA